MKKTRILFSLTLIFLIISILLPNKSFALKESIKIGKESFDRKEGIKSNRERTAVYNPTENTLTLTNYNGEEIKYFEEDELTIILIGNNIITAKERKPAGAGITIRKANLNIIGDGSLEISNYKNGISFEQEGNLNINVNDTIKIKDTDSGISVDKGNLTVSGNGVLQIIDSQNAISVDDGNFVVNKNIDIQNIKNDAIFVDGNMSVNASNIKIAGVGNGINIMNNSFDLNNGNVDIDIAKDPANSQDIVYGLMNIQGSINLNSGKVDINVPENGVAIATIYPEGGRAENINISENLGIYPEIYSLQSATINYMENNMKAITIGFDNVSATIDRQGKFLLNNVANSVTIEPKRETFTYKFVAGDNQKFLQNSIVEYMFEIDGDSRIFEDLSIGPINLIKNIDYTVTDGRTIFTFTKNGIAKLNTLAVGTSEIRAKYSNDITVTGSLIIEAKPAEKPVEHKDDTPKTGIESFNIIDIIIEFFKNIFVKK